jgi:hypothetical protein
MVRAAGHLNRRRARLQVRWVVGNGLGLGPSTI